MEFSRVVCINRDDRPDRWQKFLSGFNSIEDNPFKSVERISAFTPETVPIPQPKWYDATGDGSWACYLSHMYQIKRAIDDGIKSLLIFEDDAVFEPDFRKHYDKFFYNIPNNWEVVYLGGKHKRKPKMTAPWFSMCSDTVLHHAWGMRDRGLTKVYEHLNDFGGLQQLKHRKQNKDQWIGEGIFNNKFKTYSPSKVWMVHQDAGYSDRVGKLLGNKRGSTYRTNRSAEWGNKAAKKSFSELLASKAKRSPKEPKNNTQNTLNTFEGYWTKPDLDAKYYEYISDKTVAIVGPAPTIDGTLQADYINSFDVVVRLNKAIPILNKQDTGDRCDILYHCGLVDENRGGQVPRSDLDWFCLAHNFIKLNNRRFKRSCSHVAKIALAFNYNLHVTPLGIYEELCHYCGSPNIGTTAIYDILSHNPRQLYITGLTVGPGYSTSYKTDISEEEQREADSYHDFQKQRLFLRSIVNQHKDIIVSDKFFMEAIGVA